MNIRKTTLEDLEKVMAIYRYARQFMAEHGNPNQWGPTQWPPEEIIRHDIAVGKGYVCTNVAGEVIGSFYFDQGINVEPTYLDITDGTWRDESSYGVVHRLAGNGSEKGIGAFCLNWAFAQCGHMRIDTHGDNIVMQNLLSKLGFERRGIVYVVEDKYPRFAYEK